ncbi:MAG: UDP-N-acetylmuramate:L-alanyl-gamma-D-glutamyl-meso-diaminopimelate ligase, partial [Gemmatimonadetes bacterium]|nr:UDP-N-acetylmuramate:L-alanyl-gamma-D-glutamyl-meso-diaminopimelate ligase [Gemmatimonadota bacterium]NIQ55433.1 UDP-N-acetylmuramate:L-alanyl-gamma-D-glutamyl-meso-diaminopimelate ligase [Gemmatimonadota bacterium]NIU75641.1 UDP-N-acetylmuramate:L-alanyl-gamma-D-glutamyl-meso-diaminopimelate ligase [Gammaproteobacteria bacterium]NIX48304.1 UDP-N-acetylmuramate:L-alanyl-gamma-D-glutamyl-meso-diaminopimelate ligase [Gemmatimonadota bacterium]NIY09599.1 UDP-N-acetylmuramate:L-alanyl-gamma-D-gl
MHYHLIGIAGTAMGSLAGLLREAGHTVTGSDEGVYPPMSTLLDDLGIPYARRFDPANLDPAPDVVVVGNAVSRGNPELEAALERRLRYTSAAATVKREFLWDRRVLAVAGTHGKTTTTAILAWLLESAGLEPSFLIGGVAENFGTSFRLTDSDLFVIEADEYDTAYFDKGPKMWHYLPHVAVVTNIEFDHADIYRDDEAYRFAFSRFINLTPGNGTLVAGWESPVVRELAPRSFAPVESFGLGEATVPGEAAERRPPGTGEVRSDRATEPEGLDRTLAHPRWRADGIEYGAEGALFNVYHDGECLGDVTTPLTGAFNVRNCLAAIAAAVAVGAEWDGIVEGLRTFRSVRRRMEIRGEVDGVTVIDDFAHHPTAVRETIEAVRQRFGGRRVIAVFEPRSYTAQRRDFQEPYRSALNGADEVVLAGLFHPERYDADSGMDPDALVADIAADGTPARYVPETGAIVGVLAPGLRSRDVVLFMSNGGFGGV